MSFAKVIVDTGMVKMASIRICEALGLDPFGQDAEEAIRIATRTDKYTLIHDWCNWHIFADGAREALIDAIKYSDYELFKPSELALKMGGPWPLTWEGDGEKRATADDGYYYIYDDGDGEFVLREDNSLRNETTYPSFDRAKFAAQKDHDAFMIYEQIDGE